MLVQHLHLPANFVTAFYSIFVGHRNTLQIASRLIGTSESPVMPDALTAFLHESLTHFEIMAEEDPEYKRMRILQDGKFYDIHLVAGVIPVIQPVRGGPLLQARDADRQLREVQRKEFEEAKRQDELRLKQE